MSMLDPITSSPFALCTILIILYITWRYLSTPRNLPPGPPSLPIVGSIPFIEIPLQKSIEKWRGKYGDIISFYLGKQLTVAITRYDLIKELFLKRAAIVSARPDDIFKTVVERNTGVIFSDGPAWKEQRRFALMALRDFGMGKRSMEDPIREEAMAFIDELKKHKGAPINVQNLMNAAVSNVICSIVFGKRFEYNDKEFLKSIDNMNSIITTGITALLAEFINIPFLRNLPGDPLQYQKFKSYINDIVTWINGHIAQHKVDFDPNDQKDFIDVYLNAVNTRKESGDDFSALKDNSLPAMVLDLFAAGTETTSNTLRWALLFWMLHEDIQDKIRREIDAELGRDQLPSGNDRARLPYTDAFLMEVQRLGNIVPNGVAHSNIEDLEIGGYTIPKGTTIFGSLYLVLMDPQNFPDPRTFKPERFLNEDGTKTIKSEYLIPFGIGKRSCMGESLAKSELFLFFVTMVQRLDFRLPENASIPDLLEHRVGLTRAPPPYELCAFPREDNKTNSN